MTWQQALQRWWFAPTPPYRSLWQFLPILLPLHWLFIALSSLRSFFYRLGWKIGWKKNRKLPVPVIVIGNITVGGAGKTPLTLALVAALQAQGLRPGIISRGYGGKQQGICAVAADADPAWVGDEPVLLARRSQVPTFIGRQRAVAGQALLRTHPEVNVLVCDDGLQHLALARDIELAVFDERGAGNGWRLPLGPLRESVSRLNRCTAIVHNLPPGATNKLVEQAGLAQMGVPQFVMHLRPGEFYNLQHSQQQCTVADLQASGLPLHALAGIGNPQRFFNTLSALGLDFTEHVFPDHHPYQAADLAFAHGGILLMTEKDAVKCAKVLPPAQQKSVWVLPVAAELPEALIDLLVCTLRKH